MSRIIVNRKTYIQQNKVPAQAGFTLIELLVVIAIIGMLASIIIASLDSARVKGRDARRVSDMREIMNALALYQSDNNGAYPNSSSNWYNSQSAQPWIQSLTSTYIAAVPIDPTNTNSATKEVIYYYNSDGTDYCLQISQENSCSTNPYYRGVWSGTCKLRVGTGTWCSTH